MSWFWSQRALMTEFDINHKAVSNAEYEVIGVGSAILPAPCSSLNFLAFYCFTSPKNMPVSLL